MTTPMHVVSNLQNSKSRQQPNTMTAYDPRSQEITQINWIIENFAAREKITIIGGSAGSGKSLLTHFLSMSSDNTIFSFKPGKTIYLAGADASREELIRRDNKIRRSSNRVMLLSDLNRDILLDITNQAFYKDIVSLCLENGADSIIFDTIADFFIGELHKPREANKAMVSFRNLAEETKTAVILITHTRKGTGEKRNLSIEDISDSRIFGTKADLAFALKTDPSTKNLIELQNVKNRLGKQLESIRMEILEDSMGFLSFRQVDRLFSFEVKKDEKKLEKTGMKMAMQKLKNEGKSYAEIGKFFNVSKQYVFELIGKQNSNSTM